MNKIPLKLHKAEIRQQSNKNSCKAVESESEMFLVRLVGIWLAWPSGGILNQAKANWEIMTRHLTWIVWLNMSAGLGVF